MRSPLSILFAFVFFIDSVCPHYVGAQPASPAGRELVLPVPGTRVSLSPSFDPPVLKGIKVHPENPFRLDFILDRGSETSSAVKRESNLAKEDYLKEESTKIIKYFLAALTTPEKDLRVNLSPYEKDRIVPESFGKTEMGRDLLAQDYLLKQITASLVYPEGDIGKQFWKRVYEIAGNKNVPVNTFNKVWIVPDKAVVYENAKSGTAYVVESSLKVLTEQDYLAQDKNAAGGAQAVRFARSLRGTMALSPACPSGDACLPAGRGDREDERNSWATGPAHAIRDLVIPQLTKEVNTGANFAQLRQVYNSLILATWYKKKIKGSILSEVYADKNKVDGIKINDPKEKERIYAQYLEAFKKGAYNYIKEEQDPILHRPIPRKYFSGGVSFGVDQAMRTINDLNAVPNMDHAQLVRVELESIDHELVLDQAQLVATREEAESILVTIDQMKEIQQQRALTREEIQQFSEQFPSLDWEKAAYVPWEEVVHDPRREPGPQNLNQLHMWQNLFDVRRQCLFTVKGILDGKMDTQGFKTALIAMHRRLLLGESGSRPYFPRLMRTLAKLQDESSYGVLNNHMSAKSNALFPIIDRFFKSKDVDINKKLDYLAEFYVVFMHPEYFFQEGNNSLVMDMINGLLRLSRSNGIAHGNMDRLFLMDIDEITMRNALKREFVGLFAAAQKSEQINDGGNQAMTSEVFGRTSEGRPLLDGQIVTLIKPLDGGETEKSIVYLAQTADGMRIAVKTPKGDLAVQEEFFEQEKKKIVSLERYGGAKFFGEVQMMGGGHVIKGVAMELIDGVDGAFLESKRSVTPFAITDQHLRWMHLLLEQVKRDGMSFYDPALKNFMFTREGRVRPIDMLVLSSRGDWDQQAVRALDLLRSWVEAHYFDRAMAKVLDPRVSALLDWSDKHPDDVKKMTLQQIADRFDLSRITVKRRLQRKDGLPGRRESEGLVPYRKWAEDHRDQKVPYTWAEIAAMFSLSATVAYDENVKGGYGITTRGNEGTVRKKKAGVAQFLEWAQAHRGQAVPETQEDLATRFGIDRSRVSQLLSEGDFGITTNSGSDPDVALKKQLKAEKDLRIWAERSGMSSVSEAWLRKNSQILGLPVDGARAILSEFGIFVADGVKGAVKNNVVYTDAAMAVPPSQQEANGTKLLREYVKDKKGLAVNYSLSELASMFSISKPTVQKILKEYSIKTSGNKISKGGAGLMVWAQQHKKQIIKETQEEIAAKFGVSRTRVSQVMLQHEITMQHAGQKKATKRLHMVAQRLKRKGVTIIKRSLSDLTQRFELSDYTVRNVLKEYGISFQRASKQAEFLQWAEDHKGKIISDTIMDIAEKFNVSYSYASKVFQEQAIMTERKLALSKVEGLKQWCVAHRGTKVDMTFEQIRVKFNLKYVQTVWSILRKYKVTAKFSPRGYIRPPAMMKFEEWLRGTVKDGVVDYFVLREKMDELSISDYMSRKIRLELGINEMRGAMGWAKQMKGKTDPRTIKEIAGYYKVSGAYVRRLITQYKITTAAQPEYYLWGSARDQKDDPKEQRVERIAPQWRQGVHIAAKGFAKDVMRVRELTAEEEKVLAEEMLTGNEVAEQALVFSRFGQVQAAAFGAIKSIRRTLGSSVSSVLTADEIIGDGVDLLLQAARAYSTHKEFKSKSFAEYLVGIKFVPSLFKNAFDVAREALMFNRDFKKEGDEEAESLIDTIGVESDIEEKISAIEVMTIFEEALKLLGFLPLQIEVIERKFFDEYTEDEILDWLIIRNSNITIEENREFLEDVMVAFDDHMESIGPERFRNMLTNGILPSDKSLLLSLHSEPVTVSKEESFDGGGSSVIEDRAMMAVADMSDREKEFADTVKELGFPSSARILSIGATFGKKLKSGRLRQHLRQVRAEEIYAALGHHVDVFQSDEDGALWQKATDDAQRPAYMQNIQVYPVRFGKESPIAEGSIDLVDMMSVITNPNDLEANPGNIYGILDGITKVLKDGGLLRVGWYNDGDQENEAARTDFLLRHLRKYVELVEVTSGENEAHRWVIYKANKINSDEFSQNMDEGYPSFEDDSAMKALPVKEQTQMMKVLQMAKESRLRPLGVKGETSALNVLIKSAGGAKKALSWIDGFKSKDDLSWEDRVNLRKMRIEILFMLGRIKQAKQEIFQLRDIVGNASAVSWGIGDEEFEEIRLKGFLKGIHLVHKYIFTSKTSGLDIDFAGPVLGYQAISLQGHLLMAQIYHDLGRYAQAHQELGKCVSVTDLHRAYFEKLHAEILADIHKKMDEHPERRGGIDLNSDRLDLGIKNDGGSMSFHFDPAVIKQLQSVLGFTPVIINIQPLPDVKAFLINR